MIRVLFANRDPSLMDGGDTNKINNYWEQLNKLGIECGYLHNILDSDEYGNWDIIHGFHLGHEFSYKFYLESVRKHKPYVMSPIYFPNQGNPVKYRQEMVEGARAVLYLSEGERESVGRLFDEPTGVSHIVPNGIDPVFGTEGRKYVHPNRPDEDYVLCVGRIDGRKNQVALTRACMELDVPLLLVGEPADGYEVRACQSMADSWDGLWWEGPADRERLAEAYRGAKVLACPSIVEMWPNVVAEGGLAGCNLVVSNGSMTFTDFDGVYTCGTTIDSIKEAIEPAYKNDKKSLKSQFEDFTWESTAKQLKGIYEGVLA